MMGDIITDLASVLQGGMGFAAGGNIGDAHAMFEPGPRSAPKYAGKNQVNPFGDVRGGGDDAALARGPPCRLRA